MFSLSILNFALTIVLAYTCLFDLQSILRDCAVLIMLFVYYDTKPKDRYLILFPQPVRSFVGIRQLSIIFIHVRQQRKSDQLILCRI